MLPYTAVIAVAFIDIRSGIINLAPAKLLKKNIKKTYCGLYRIKR